MNESKTDKKQIIAETYRHLLETTPGDKITVKINGSSYTKKITNVRAKTIYVPVSRTIAYTPFKVTLKNKYRQKMLVKTLYL